MFKVDSIEKSELATLLQKNESHYLDFKSKDISGKDLQRHLVGFANADGGELYVGISEDGDTFRVDPFSNIEDANQLVQAAILEITPAIEDLVIDFLKSNDKSHIVRIVIPKSPKLHHTSSGDCYVRLSAQTQKIKGEDVAALAYSKGFYKFEEQPVTATTPDEIIDSGNLSDYLERIGSKQEPLRFLRRNRLLDVTQEEERVNVGCVLLFDEDPDEVLSTKASVKILRMKTTSDQYKRDQLSNHEKLSGPSKSW